ncbi:HAD-IA family hydrolase [Pseudonocardia xinjiangensis]|uniref:HAD-IA family hydrolase n=1 Tax=Pseudonocardia xinjiangensis TaxID=75289 RepID=A0ABX1RQN2_9PSEU|nr:HAD-IA family hydrolase [Pseudonocardia xinjiangensis]NMH81829.1 HAD-IA family hydrolase [Pseudonocardia xinjiangensis]
MDRSGPPAAVVFDIGGVLGGSEAGGAVLAAEVGVESSSFTAAYWRHRDGYDLGSDAEEYWSRVGADVGRTFTPAEMRRLDRRDAQRWAGLAPGIAALLARVAAAGVRMGLLSNAPHSLATEVRGSAWGAMFPTKVFSCEAGVAKPRPGAYAAVEDELGLSGADLLFFDDRPVNVAAARERGWWAHRWQGPRQCLADLAAAGVHVPGRAGPDADGPVF